MVLGSIARVFARKSANNNALEQSGVAQHDVYSWGTGKEGQLGMLSCAHSICANLIVGQTIVNFRTDPKKLDFFTVGARDAKRVRCGLEHSIAITRMCSCAHTRTHFH
jgi:alpha-tubulin suppressor-like RCC1 family protein